MGSTAEQWRYNAYQNWAAYNRAQIDKYDREHNNMSFKIGDRVHLKGGPAHYRGSVNATSTLYGTWVLLDEGLKVYLKTADLEEDIDPQVGDIYVDKDGGEWVVTKDHMHMGTDDLIVKPIDQANEMFYTNYGQARDRKIENWISRCQPRLVRRRP